MLLKNFIYLILVGYSLELENDESISCIIDFVKKQTFSVKVNAYLCWSSGHKLKLWKLLSEKLIAARITDPHQTLIYSGSKHQQLFLIDMNCEGSKNLLIQAEHNGMLRYPFKWIVMRYKTSFNLHGHFFGPDSSIYVIEKTETKYKIKLFYKLTKNNTQFIENDLAAWENGKWLYYNSFSISRNRTNLMGSNFKVSYVFTKPDSVNEVYDYRNKHLESMTKTNYLTIHHLIAALNVTEVPPKIHKSWGYIRSENMTYDGMIGDLQRNEIDVAGSGILITAERLDMLDYISPGFQSTLAEFVFRAPPLPYITNIFLLPFNTSVWYACLALLLTILLVLYLITLWEWKEPTARKLFKPILRPKIIDVFITELGAITQQGAEREPKSVSGRIATLFTFIAFMFLYNAFCANIVALLQSTSDSIRTTKDLYSTDISIGADDVIYSQHYFKADPRPLTKAIIDEKLRFMNPVEGVHRMKNEFFVFHGEPSTIFKIVGETFSEAEICALREIKYFDEFPLYFSVHKNSTYTELLKYTMQKMHETGIIKCEERRIFATKPQCTSQGSFGSVGITECKSAYIIWGIGTGCSVAVLLLELLWKYIKSKMVVS